MIIVSRDKSQKLSELKILGKDSKGFDIYEVTPVDGRWVFSSEDWEKYKSLNKRCSEY